MMVFALYAAYCSKIYGEWEALLNHISDELDDVIFAPSTPAQEASAQDTENAERQIRLAA